MIFGLNKPLSMLANLHRQNHIDDQFSSVYDIYNNFLVFLSNTMLRTFLKTFQLTEKEIKIFQKVLELGAQPASHIARVCEMPRNTVRSMLDNLVRKGLMVKSTRANTQYYATEKKENLMRMLKFKKLRTDEEVDTQLKMLEEYGEELSARHWATNRPRITFYEGISGLEKVYEDTLTSGEGLRSWASYDGLLEAMPEYFKTYFKRRAKKGIVMQSIHPDTPASEEGQARDSMEKRQSALVPADRFNWTPEIQVYDNKVNITSWKEKLGIIIESQEIADALKVIFDLSYEAAEKYGKSTPPVTKN
jgi:sugar-specific transcriptional regulator TrmB